jgi:hypothetical protein
MPTSPSGILSERRYCIQNYGSDGEHYGLTRCSVSVAAYAKAPLQSEMAIGPYPQVQAPS